MDSSLEILGKENACNTCKVFSAKPYGKADTSPLQQFRTEVNKQFQITGVDFAGPLGYKVNKNKESTAFILTCSVTRAAHLEVAKSETAEEFQYKLNALNFRDNETTKNRVRQHSSVSNQ